MFSLFSKIKKWIRQVFLSRCKQAVQFIWCILKHGFCLTPRSYLHISTYKNLGKLSFWGIYAFFAKCITLVHSSHCFLFEFASALPERKAEMLNTLVKVISTYINNIGLFFSQWLGKYYCKFKNVVRGVYFWVYGYKNYCLTKNWKIETLSFRKLESNTFYTSLLFTIRQCLTTLTWVVFFFYVGYTYVHVVDYLSGTFNILELICNIEWLKSFLRFVAIGFHGFSSCTAFMFLVILEPINIASNSVSLAWKTVLCGVVLVDKFEVTIAFLLNLYFIFWIIYCFLYIDYYICVFEYWGKISLYNKQSEETFKNYLKNESPYRQPNKHFTLYFKPLYHLLVFFYLIFLGVLHYYFTLTDCILTSIESLEVFTQNFLVTDTRRIVCVPNEHLIVALQDYLSILEVDKFNISEDFTYRDYHTLYTIKFEANLNLRKLIKLFFLVKRSSSSTLLSSKESIYTQIEGGS